MNKKGVAHRIGKHLRVLSKFGYLPHGWLHFYGKVEKMESLDERLLQDLDDLHKLLAQIPDVLQHVGPLLVELHNDLERLKKKGSEQDIGDANRILHQLKQIMEKHPELKKPGKLAKLMMKPLPGASDSVDWQKEHNELVVILNKLNKVAKKKDLSGLNEIIPLLVKAYKKPELPDFKHLEEILEKLMGNTYTASSRFFSPQYLEDKNYHLEAIANNMCKLVQDLNTRSYFENFVKKTTDLQKWFKSFLYELWQLHLPHLENFGKIKSLFSQLFKFYAPYLVKSAEVQEKADKILARAKQLRQEYYRLRLLRGRIEEYVVGHYRISREQAEKEVRRHRAMPLRPKEKSLPGVVRTLKLTLEGYKKVREKAQPLMKEIIGFYRLEEFDPHTHIVEGFVESLDSEIENYSRLYETLARFKEAFDRDDQVGMAEAVPKYISYQLSTHSAFRESWQNLGVGMIRTGYAGIVTKPKMGGHWMYKNPRQPYEELPMKYYVGRLHKILKRTGYIPSTRDLVHVRFMGIDELPNIFFYPKPDVGYGSHAVIAIDVSEYCVFRNSVQAAGFSGEDAIFTKRRIPPSKLKLFIRYPESVNGGIRQELIELVRHVRRMKIPFKFYNLKRRGEEWEEISPKGLYTVGKKKAPAKKAPERKARAKKRAVA